MRIPISDLIDKMTIIKLKIERVGEPHLKKEYEEYKKVVKNYKIQGETIGKEWFDKLYDINGKIWDIEFGVREIVDKLYNNIGVPITEEELVEIGKKHLLVAELGRKRNSIKNQIVSHTGEGFKIIKIDHPGE